MLGSLQGRAGEKSGAGEAAPFDRTTDGNCEVDPVAEGFQSVDRETPETPAEPTDGWDGRAVGDTAFVFDAGRGPRRATERRSRAL